MYIFFSSLDCRESVWTNIPKSSSCHTADHHLIQRRSRMSVCTAIWMVLRRNKRGTVEYRGIDLASAVDLTQSVRMGARGRTEHCATFSALEVG